MVHLVSIPATRGSPTSIAAAAPSVPTFDSTMSVASAVSRAPLPVSMVTTVVGVLLVVSVAVGSVLEVVVGCWAWVVGAGWVVVVVGGGGAGWVVVVVAGGGLDVWTNT